MKTPLKLGQYVLVTARIDHKDEPIWTGTIYDNYNEEYLVIPAGLGFNAARYIEKNRITPIP